MISRSQVLRRHNHINEVSILILSIAWISFNYGHWKIMINSVKFLFKIIQLFLLFDAFNDMKILPSKSILINALNYLLNHSLKIIGSTYLLWNLPRLSDEIIIEWMQLKDNESISKFCQCLFRRYPRKSETIKYVHKLPSIVYQQLWSFHNRSPSIEFEIDQVLRSVMLRDKITDQIFNKDFSRYLFSHYICLTNIHPLILSVIIEVEVYFIDLKIVYLRFYFLQNKCIVNL
jgi:hypothetical protein